MQDQALNEKWAPVLNESTLPEIKDEYRRNVTAILLENQEKALQEAAPTNVAAGVAGYDPVLISMVRRAAPNLIAFDVCGLQPMTTPTGLVFALRSRYSTQAGTEALWNESDTSFSGGTSGSVGGSSGVFGSYLGVQVMSAAVTSGSANVTVTSTANIQVGQPLAATEFAAGTTVASITNGTVFVASSNATATNATTTIQLGNANGGGILTATGEGDITAKVAMSIEKLTVTAATYQLASGYSLEMAQDMKALHGLDAESELSHIMSTELITETNRRVLRTIYNLAKPGAQKATLPGVFNFAADTDGRWSNEKFKGLLFAIERDANAIAYDLRMGKGNILICSGDVASALAAAGSMSYAPAIQQLETLNADFTQSTFVGTIGGKMKVFVDPYASADFYCVGYKGSSPYAAGAFYAPYVAAQLQRATDPTSFQPLMALKSRAGFATNPFGGATFRSNGFYRIASVQNLHG
jgi:hypothetical protein